MNKEGTSNNMRKLKADLAELDVVIDKGEGDEDVVNKRTNVVRSLPELEKLQSVEVAQKAKIKWAIEGDENSKYYHCILNKKRSQLLDMNFSNILNYDQQADLECEVTNDEIKRAVWDCGTDKSPGPDGFTFGFYRRYWKIIKSDVVDVVSCFIQKGYFPKGGNSSFITLIPKTHVANMVKDFRPISLIGSLYKIIAKLLANRLVVVLGSHVNEVQSAFVADRQLLDGPFILNEIFQWCKSKKKQSLVLKVYFEKSYDSVRWDYLDDILRKFGFGDKWHGDPLSPFLFILVMESLHVSFQRLVDAVKSIHGGDGKIGKKAKSTFLSLWLDIVHEVELLKDRCIDLISFIHKKLGNGADTLFWEDAWRGGTAFKYLYPRVYVLESSKNIDVASKMAHCNLDYSFRRDPRGGVKKAQFDLMFEKVEGTLLADMRDRWTWSLEGSGDFSVASVRKLLDGNMLPEVASKTRWIKAMPIKVNVHAWRVKLDCLPTRINISRRGMKIESIICPMCGEAAESCRRIFFSCHIARDFLRKISRWWDVSYMELSSYEEWLDWILNIRISVKHKQILEGVCYAMWWHIWNFRNKCIFDSESPSKEIIFEDVVYRSFYWCRYRCKGSFSWIEWLKNPYLLSL
ncbi:RNA-directed DNA polymerase, eukaryota [Tanacetum coccineum]